MVLIQENMSLNWLDVSIFMNGTVLSQSSQAYLSLQKWLTEGVTYLPREVWQNLYVTYFTSEMCGTGLCGMSHSLMLCGKAIGVGCHTGAVWRVTTVACFTSEMCGYKFVWHVSQVLCGRAVGVVCLWGRVVGVVCLAGAVWEDVGMPHLSGEAYLAGAVWTGWGHCMKIKGQSRVLRHLNRWSCQKVNLWLNIT